MHNKLLRFFETTLPMVIGFGTVVVTIAILEGFWWGIAGVMLFAIVDVLMTRGD